MPKITGNLKSFIEGLLFSLTTSASESLQPFSGKNCQWDAVQGASTSGVNLSCDGSFERVEGAGPGQRRDRIRLSVSIATPEE